MPWTEITRLHYRREGLRYASDATDAEWLLIEPFMPAANSIGRPRTTNVREVVNALFYIASTGCQWRQLPREFPPYSTVQGYFYPWSRDGTWVTINHALVVVARENEGRQASPTAGVIDSQSAKTTESGGTSGYDAGKKIRGERDTSLPIRLDISLVCRCILPTSKIGTVQFLCSARSGRSIPGYATSSLMAPMRATS
jgi:transposase